MEEDSPAEVDSSVMEGVRSSGEVGVHNSEVVVVRSSAAMDTPHALVLDKTTSQALR